MLNDSELMTLMLDREVLDQTMKMKREFLKAESQFLDLGDDDFVAMVLLAPSVGIALANGNMSLYEDLSLQNKAKKLSRGGYFLKKDPIFRALRYLIKNFSAWEDRFYSLIKLAMFSSLKKNPQILEALFSPSSITGNLGVDVLNSPYIFVKFLAFLFLERDEDLINERMISEVELQKLKEIGVKLGIDAIPIFQLFCKTFDVKH